MGVFSFQMKNFSEQLRGKLFALYFGVFCSMILMVLLVVVVSNTQIKLYDGMPYIEALWETLNERHTGEYLAALDSFDDIFSFLWMLF